MPAVFVPGNPETGALYDSLRRHLTRDDHLALDPPGFGAPRPAGFGATKEEYVDWLIGELEGVDGPVDLVGHDWGGGFASRVAMLRSDLLRSWAVDTFGLLDEEYEWHDFAKVWQTPGAGEDMVRSQLEAPLDQRSQLMQGFGIPPVEADRLVTWFNEEMARSVLDLYRSAVTVSRDWGPDLERASAPALAILAPQDPFVGCHLVERTAARIGARVATLDGLGHWWMLQDPARGAQVLEEFWSSL